MVAVYVCHALENVFATALLLFVAGRKLRGTPAGLVAAATFATSLGFVLIARQVMFDALLTLWTTAALLGFWFGTSPSERPGSRRSWLLAGYAAMGMGVLTKGLLGLALPVMVLVGFAAAQRDARRLRAAADGVGALLFLSIAVPWHAAAALRHDRFAWFYFVNEHWLRFLGRRQPPDFHKDPVYAPAVAALLLIFPWTALLPAALRELYRRRGGARLPEGSLLAGWILAPVLFFTISRTRTYYYLLPVVPPLALSLALLWTRLRGRGRALLSSPWTLAPLAALLVAATGAWAWAGAHSAGGSGSAARHEIEFAAGIWFPAGLAVSWVAARRRRRLPVFLAPAAATILAVLTIVGLLRGRTDQLQSGLSAAAVVRRFAWPGTVIAMEGKYENHSSFAFYLPLTLSPALAVEGHRGGDLEFGGRLRGSPRVFATTAELFEIASRRPVFYLTLTPSRLSVPNSLHVVQRDDWATLWSNCVPPAWPASPTNSPYVLWNSGGWTPPAGTDFEASAGYAARSVSGTAGARASSVFCSSTALATAWPRKWLFRIAYAPPAVRPAAPAALPDAPFWTCSAFSAPSRILSTQGASSVSE
jgi:4-amino-4-deoxy-L-arabinose transferase-like glycosyltransferase